MSGKKLTDPSITHATTLDVADIFYVVRDPGGTPADHKVTLTVLHQARTQNRSLREFASLNAAVAAIGSTQTTLEINTTTTVSASLDVPANITFLPIGTALISVSSGQVLTYRGSTEGWPLRQIFTGTGGVILAGPMPWVTPHWFNSKGDAKIVNDASVSGTTLTSATAAFTAADTGKKFDVAGVGAADVFSAVIVTVTDTTHVVVNIPASYTGSSKTVSLDSATIATGSMTAGGTTITVGSAFFVVGRDEGKIVRVTDVGARNIAGTLTFVDATTCTMSVSASAALSSRRLIYGTDDQAAIAKAVAALPSGGEVRFARSKYLVGSVVSLTADMTVSGAGQTASMIYAVGPLHTGSAGTMFNIFRINNGVSNVHFEDIGLSGTNWTAQSPGFVDDCDGVNIGTTGPIDNITATRCSFNCFWSIGFHCGGSGTLVFGAVTSVTNISLIDVECAFNAFDGANPNPGHGLIIIGGRYHHNGTAGIECSTYHGGTIDTYTYHNIQGGVGAGGYGGVTEFGVNMTVRGVHQYNGIYGVVLGSNMKHCRVTVHASNNGLLGIQISPGPGGSVTNGHHVLDGCTTNNNGSKGILVGVDNCIIRGCNGTGNLRGLELVLVDNTIVDDNNFLGNVNLDYAFESSTNILFSVKTPGAVVTESGPTTFQALRGLSGSAEGFVTVTASATPVYDASRGNTFKITLTTNVTSSTLVKAAAGQWITYKIIQGGVGSFTHVWPTNVKWAGGTAPTLSTAVGKLDEFSGRFDGTNLNINSQSLDVR